MIKLPDSLQSFILSLHMNKSVILYNIALEHFAIGLEELLDFGGCNALGHIAHVNLGGTAHLGGGVLDSDARAVEHMLVQNSYSFLG